MRENSYPPYVDADNYSIKIEQRTEVNRIESVNSFPWKLMIYLEEVIFDFDTVEYLSNSLQVQLIYLIKDFLLDDKRIRFVNLKPGIIPDFLYWIQ